MAETTLTTVVNQIQQYWSPTFATELRESLIFPELVFAVDRLKPGSIVRQGNTVKVSQVNKLTGANNAASDCTFTTEALALQDIDVTIDQRAHAGLEFCDIVELQSQINLSRPDVRQAMMHGLKSQINTYLYGVVTTNDDNPSTATIDASTLTAATQKADEALWPEDNRWLIVDPQYRKDLLDDATLTSADFGATDRPVIGGQMVLERYGWKIIMDNSAAFKTALNASGGGVGLFFTDTFMHYVPQTGADFKASDGHNNKEFKIYATIDQVYGAAMGNDGADKTILYRTGV